MKMNDKRWRAPFRKKMAALLAAILVVPVFAAAGSAGLLTVKAQQQTDAPQVSPLTSYNEDVLHLAYVTEVEDQAQTNYCWAYMADAVLESYLLRTGRAGQSDFSEADMIYQMGNGGANGFYDLTRGGSYRQALAYWTRGIQYGPRREIDGSLTDYYVSGTIDLGAYRKDDAQAKQDYIRDIKSLVTQYGAVGVSVYFNSIDKVLTTNNGAYYYPQEASPGVNHGVTIVGWNDYFPATWFYNTRTAPRQPNSQGAFLVKNSWGKNDSSSINGNTGYYWISYENYFQDAFAVTQVVDRQTLYDHIYETDFRGLSEYAPGSSYSRTYRLSAGTEQLSGFATYVKAGCYYRFYVNGRELTQFTGTMANSGYRTFRLADPLPIGGTVLNLQVQVIGDDAAVPVSCTADSQIADYSNVCLKAFTVNGAASNTGTVPSASYGSVTGVYITPQDCQMRPGMSQSFQVWVTGTGQPSQQVSWQLSGSSSSATKLENGRLYIGNDETSRELYVYAVSAADDTKQAVAKVVLESEPEPSSARYTVTFVNEGEICKTQTVAYGAAATPPVLTKEGYTLQWDCDYSHITANTVVNAVWTAENTDMTDPPVPDDTDLPLYQEDDNGIVKNLDKERYLCWKDGTAWYTKCTAKNQIMVIVPAKIQVNGMDYSVTVMEANCLRGHQKVLNAKVGKNVTEIGDHAFAGCRQLKKIRIRTEKLQTIGEGAFRNISEKATVYVPRRCLAQYRDMIRLSGNTKVRVKAFE